MGEFFMIVAGGTIGGVLGAYVTLKILTFFFD